MAATGKIEQLDSRPAAFWAALSLVIALVVGTFDYLSGYELSFFAFYLFPVTLAVWFIGPAFGMGVSVFCVLMSVAGDVFAGARYSSSWVPVWNTLILLIFFLVVVLILGRLRALQNKLEERVRERTAALQNEMQERARLEEEILDISEREQRRIGHDLHDSLCQDLTGVALAGEVLSEKLTAKGLPEAKAIDHIVEMIESSIELTRTLARGLHPVELEGEGFIDALRQLAAGVTEKFNMPCAFECDAPVVISDTTAATHLYRIAQEALANAVKHSKASETVIGLKTDDGVTLTIYDDGVGVPENPGAGKGMGFRIMAYRASVIGAAFNIARGPTRGTRVTCKLPAGSFILQSHG